MGRRCARCATDLTRLRIRPHAKFCSSTCRYKAWRAVNGGSRSEYISEWKRANKPAVSSHNAQRRAAKHEATPAWANRRAITAIYSLARHQSAEHGVDVHVDHIVPLKHPLVCGLHCEANLQLMLAEDNLAKKNSWWPHMWEPSP